jgi:hypothetical protein
MVKVGGSSLLRCAINRNHPKKVEVLLGCPSGTWSDDDLDELRRRRAPYL